MGPAAPDETLTEYPTTRYLVGRLAPARDGDDDDAAALDPLENDSLGIGPDGIGPDGAAEEGTEEFNPPLIVGFHPSSFGLSFLIDSEVQHLNVKVCWGDYKRERAGAEGGTHWQRYQREAVVQGVAVGHTGPTRQIPLSQKSAPPGISVAGVDDPEVTIEGVVHEVGGDRAVSLFLVNRRTKSDVTDRAKDERWLLQAQLEVTGTDGSTIFKAKNLTSQNVASVDDDELQIANLLYSHAKEFASGHGVAAGWDGEADDGNSVSRLYTDWIPSFEVPNLVAPSDKTGSADLDMLSLSKVKEPNQLRLKLEPMLKAYEAWISSCEDIAAKPPISADKELHGVALELISGCRNTFKRMSRGLELIINDVVVFEAFKFLNYVMWDQRIHSLWASENRSLSLEVSATSKDPDSPRIVSGRSVLDFDLPKNRTWRPFQMGFVLLNLVGIAKEDSADRNLVDLLWFPTGGGKTEAYLGLAAFTLAYRRLRGDKNGLESGAGVSIIMRYTLRLLTVQQFQRAAAMICACELVRRADIGKWGEEPFRIGLWVGKKTTPNDSASSKKALEDLNDKLNVQDGSPVQLLSCPRCGTMLASDRGRPENQTYTYDRDRFRTLIHCRNRDCPFCARQSTEGIPAVVVDDEIYRTCPSLLIATVDKFARLPFKGETQSLFGFRNRFSNTYGHLTAAHGDKVGGRKVKDGISARRLLPPELIIQDELHLISGPLGTMVGLYESAVDFLSRIVHESGLSVPAKIIASTATIRRARQQIRQLYNRDLAVFPPSGLSARDSFFAREVAVVDTEDSSSGRLYVGINAPGSSTKTLLVRVYSLLLSAGQAELEVDSAIADPYATVVGYFNSLRALGGAVRLVEDDIKNVRLVYLNRQRGFPRRLIDDPKELTSRLESAKIPSLLKQLECQFPRLKGQLPPVDVLLASNMISVGVDIDRLGLMVVTGQPKTTSEYIQATSRVGRKHPGLVATMYNWMGPRDLSHYERFRSYHTALYRYVEAISVTPFSSRALDRGLRGVFTAAERLSGPNLAMETQANNYDPTSKHSHMVLDDIVCRASGLVGKENGQLVKQRLSAHSDQWAHLSNDLLRYSWLNTDRPPNNSRVLLQTAGTDNEGEWPVPASLREVEPTAAFYLSEDEG
jgi:hypothetical protein